MTYYWILFIGIAIISYIVQSSLQSKFEKYSRLALNNGMTGREVAEKMLRDNGIYDVRVISTPGSLTDHYNPTNKTVNLSSDVYSTCSVAAAAVAAHECGHAIQHARAYAPLQMRSALVPVVQFSSSIMSWVLLAGILMVNTFYLELLNQNFPFAVAFAAFTADIVFILQRFHNTLDGCNRFSGCFNKLLLFHRRVLCNQF